MYICIYMHNNSADSDVHIYAYSIIHVYRVPAEKINAWY